MSLSVIHPGNLSNLKMLLEEAKQIAGDVVECGVYKGGSALIEAETIANDGKLLHLFDTFAGMPDVMQPIDFHKPGDFGDVNEESVRKLLSPFDFVRIYPGVFSDTLKQLDGAGNFCFVHVDCDLYSSVKECCEYFYNRVVTGGIILFDDYGSPTCAGAKKAVDEFFEGKSEKIQQTGGGPVYVKRCA